MGDPMRLQRSGKRRERQAGHGFVADHRHTRARQQRRDPGGGHVARVTSDIEQLSQFFSWGGLAWLINLTLMLIVGGVMLAYDWMLALTVFVGGEALLGDAPPIRRAASPVTRLPSRCFPTTCSGTSGSAPMTRVLGERALTATAVPLNNPPPPTGVSTRSRSGACFNSSRAAVPCPAMIRRSL